MECFIEKVFEFTLECIIYMAHGYICMHASYNETNTLLPPTSTSTYGMIHTVTIIDSDDLFRINFLSASRLTYRKS